MAHVSSARPPVYPVWGLDKAQRERAHYPRSGLPSNVKLSAPTSRTCERNGRVTNKRQEVSGANSSMRKVPATFLVVPWGSNRRGCGPVGPLCCLPHRPDGRARTAVPAHLARDGASRESVRLCKTPWLFFELFPASCNAHREKPHCTVPEAVYTCCSCWDLGSSVFF